MKKKELLFTVILLVVSSAAASEEFSITNVGTVRSGGYVFIDVSPSITFETGCTRKNQIRWEMTTETDKALFSLALAAHASKSKIDVNFIANDCLGDSARPNVLRYTNK